MLSQSTPPPFARDMAPVMVMTDYTLMIRLAAALEENTVALNAAMEQLGNTRLTETEAAKYLGVEKRTMYKYRQQGSIISSKVGRNLYYLRKDLDQFMIDNRSSRTSAL